MPEMKAPKLLVSAYAITMQTIGAICSYNANKRGGRQRVFGLSHEYLASGVTAETVEHLDLFAFPSGSTISLAT